MQIGTGLTHSSTTPSDMDFLTHPASLAQTKQIGSSAVFSLPFQTLALGHYGLSVTFPARGAGLGIAFSSLGKQLYRETTVSVGAGKTIGKHMSVGFVMNGHEISIQNYGASRTVGVAASVSYDLMENLRWSLLYRNLNSPELGRSREPLPQVVTTLLDFSPLRTLSTVMELQRDLEFHSRYKFGIRWQALEPVTIATGFASHPGQFTAGILFKIRHPASGLSGQIGYAVATHPELPISQVFAFQLRLP